jgi:hypothetical protein
MGRNAAFARALKRHQPDMFRSLERGIGLCLLLSDRSDRDRLVARGLKLLVFLFALGLWLASELFFECVNPFA